MKRLLAIVALAAVACGAMVVAASGHQDPHHISLNKPVGHHSRDGRVKGLVTVCGGPPRPTGAAAGCHWVYSKVVAINKATNRAAHTETHNHGHYELTLAPGHYVVRMGNCGSSLGTCTTTATVVKHHTTIVNLREDAI